MSSWRFDAKVDISKLLELSKRLDSIPESMLFVAEEVAIQVRQNIVDDEIIDKGDLLDSITAEQRGDITLVRDGVAHGVYNEFGTSRMAARPFFAPAIEKYGEFFEKVFTRLT